MTRRRQLWILIMLAAITTALQYALQGALATRANIGAFPTYFWITDYVLWAIRSLVEALVIVYLFVTQAKTRWQSFILTCFEVGLITLITLTLGPALRSVGMGKSVEASLTEVLIGPYNAGILLFWLWNFGIAAYAPMMLASVGFAYRMQPLDAGLQVVDAETLQRTTELQAQLNDAQAEVAAARAAVQTVSVFVALPQPMQVRWIVEHRNGGSPTNTELAKLYAVHPSTVSRWIAGGE